MKVAKAIREHMGLNPHQMAKRLGVKQQVWISLERCQGKSLARLRDAYLMSGMTPCQFMQLFTNREDGQIK